MNFDVMVIGLMTTMLLFVEEAPTELVRLGHLVIGEEHCGGSGDHPITKLKPSLDAFCEDHGVRHVLQLQDEDGCVRGAALFCVSNLIQLERSHASSFSCHKAGFKGLLDPCYPTVWII